MEHNSLAARRKFMGDFSLTTSSTLPLLSSDQILASLECRSHPRPSSLFPAHILPYLYLGNDETAKNLNVLNRCGIRYVINVTSNLPNYFENEGGFCYLRIPVDDSSSHNLFQFFPEAISFIEKAHAERASVLVHCWAGISRSVTVCLAYLMYALHNTLEEAFDLLLKQNGAIAPNFHFLETLTCWERQLFEGSDGASASSSCSSTVPSSAVSIASSEASPISKEFYLDTNCESSLPHCCQRNASSYHLCQSQQQNLHTPCHKTSSSPTISMILPSTSSSIFNQTSSSTTTAGTSQQQQEGSEAEDDKDKMEQHSKNLKWNSKLKTKDENVFVQKIQQQSK